VSTLWAWRFSLPWTGASSLALICFYQKKKNVQHVSFILILPSKIFKYWSLWIKRYFGSHSSKPFVSWISYLQIILVDICATRIISWTSLILLQCSNASLSYTFTFRDINGNIATYHNLWIHKLSVCFGV